MLKKYDDAFVKKVVEMYVSDPVITQAELATKLNVPLSTMVGWLRCKRRGLTPFQRYKRNRDNVIRRRWQASSDRIKKIRSDRDSLSETYGLTKGTVRQLVYRRK